MKRTFLTRPPTVVISALRVLSLRAFSALIRSGNRSDLSSQHNEALIITFPSSSAALSTVNSSTSVGIWVVSEIIDEATKLSKMIINSFSSPPFGFAVALGSRQSFSVHDFLRRHLLQLGLEPERRRQAGLDHVARQRVGYEAEVMVVLRRLSIVSKLQPRRRRPSVEQAAVWRGWRRDEKLVVVTNRVGLESNRVEALNRPRKNRRHFWEHQI
nr:hypothetical protein Iba_chr13eCG1780 [Ipomoea batatas]